MTESVFNPISVMSIPVTLYCYKEVSGYQEYKYKIDQIMTTKKNIEYSHGMIKTIKLSSSDLFHNVILFSDIYTSDINSKCILFLFRSQSHDVLCRPSACVGSLKMEVIGSCQSNTLEFHPRDWKSQHPSELTFSIFSLLHNYVERDSAYLEHKSLSLLPCMSICIPFWISDETITEFLTSWHFSKMRIARYHTLIGIQRMTGSIVIHKCYNSTFGKPQQWQLTNKPYEERDLWKISSPH